MQKNIASVYMEVYNKKILKTKMYETKNFSKVFIYTKIYR